jgi:hypothetical protein
MSYICPRCHFETDFRCYYITHLQKKKTCNPTFSNVSRDHVIEKLNEKQAIKKKFKCDLCPKAFSHAPTLSNHKKICHSDIIVNKTPIPTENINPFGKEDIDTIVNDKLFLTDCLKSVNTTGIPNLFERIFLNDELPQNKNIKVIHESNPVMFSVFRDTNEWVDEMDNTILKYIVKILLNILREHHIELINTCVNPTSDNLDAFEQRNKRITNINKEKIGSGFVTARNDIFARLKKSKHKNKI